MLTQQQLDHYHTHGYVLLRELYDAPTVSALNERFQAFASGSVAPTDGMKIMQDVMVAKGVVEPASPVHAINKLFQFENDPELYAYTHHPQLLDAVRDVLGDRESRDLYTLVTNVFNKPPGIDGRHPLHQDLKYFRLRPANAIVGVWTALLPATRESGCLAVIPGSHTGDLLDHKSPDWEFVNFAFLGVETDAADQRVHVEMAPGDTLLFHPLIIHGSGQNTTDGFRRAISVHFARGDCESPDDDWRAGPTVRKVTVSTSPPSEVAPSTKPSPHRA